MTKTRDRLNIGSDEKSTMVRGRLFQTGATRCIKSFCDTELIFFYLAIGLHHVSEKTYQLIFARLVEYESISVKHDRREPQNSTKFPIEYIQNFGPLPTSDICHIITY